MNYVNWLIALLVTGWSRVSIPNPFHIDNMGPLGRTTFCDPITALACITTIVNKDARFIKAVNNLVHSDEQAIAVAVVRGDKLLINVYRAREGIIEFATRNAYDPFWKNSGVFQLVQPKLHDGVSASFTALCPNNAEGLKIDFYSPLLSYTHLLRDESQDRLESSKAVWTY